MYVYRVDKESNKRLFAAQHVYSFFGFSQVALCKVILAQKEQVQEGYLKSVGTLKEIKSALVLLMAQ